MGMAVTPRSHGSPPGEACKGPLVQQAVPKPNFLRTDLTFCPLILFLRCGNLAYVRWQTRPACFRARREGEREEISTMARIVRGLVLSCAAAGPTGAGCCECALHASAAGPHKRRLRKWGGSSVPLSAGSDGSVTSFAVSPTGNRVAFVAAAPQGGELRSIPPAGGALLTLAGPSTGFYPVAADRPVISADGSTVVFYATYDGKKNIHSTPLTISRPGFQINGLLQANGAVQGAVVDPRSWWVAWVGPDWYYPSQDLFSRLLVADGDDDGTLNRCDCRATDPGVYGPPHEISSVWGTKPTPTGALFTFTQADGGPSTVHDVVWGTLAGLPVGPGGGDESGVCGIASTTFSLDAVPSSASGYWVLVRGSNACARGTYGYQGVNGAHGAQRVTTTCP